VATKFFTLLFLAKSNAVRLEQKEPFGEILIDPIHITGTGTGESSVTATPQQSPSHPRSQSALSVHSVRSQSRNSSAFSPVAPMQPPATPTRVQHTSPGGNVLGQGVFAVSPAGGFGAFAPYSPNRSLMPLLPPAAAPVTLNMFPDFGAGGQIPVEPDRY